MAKNTSVTRKVRTKQGKRTVTTTSSVDSGVSVERSLYLLERSLDKEFGKGKWEFAKEYL